MRFFKNRMSEVQAVERLGGGDFQRLQQLRLVGQGAAGHLPQCHRPYARPTLLNPPRHAAAKCLDKSPERAARYRDQPPDHWNERHSMKSEDSSTPYQTGF